MSSLSKAFDPSVVDRLATVRELIATACTTASRDADTVTLIAVSKTFPAEAIEPVLQAGQRVFGENRVQEAQGKWPELRERYSGTTLHLIGPLQSNKARDAVELFDVIETVDRPKIAAALARAIAERPDLQAPKLYVQVNTGEEEQKSGILPADAVGFVAQCRNEYGLEIAGLMCIPPIDHPPGPHFAMLAQLARQCGLETLSMGMSADYEDAIMLGATHVRVGSAIFGPRTHKP